MVSLRAGGWPTIFSRLLHYLRVYLFYWGYMVGRSGLVSTCCGATLRVRVFKRPWSLRESREYAPHGCMGLMAGTAAGCMQYIRCCHFGPCTGAVHGAPGHDSWGVVETPLPVKTQGGTMNCYFYFLKSSPPSTAQCVGF